MNKKVKEKFRVFEKLVCLGYDTDKKIIEMKIEELIQDYSFNRSELNIVVGIKQALSNRNLVAFLCEIETIKNEKN